MSGGVCEPRHENGSMEHDAAVCLFCVKFGDSAATTRGKLRQAFEDAAISKASAFRWHKMFSEDKNLVEDEQRRRRSSATRTGDNTARVRELVRSDRRLAVKMIADEANMNWKTVRLIPTEELGMRTICACAQESLLTSKRITVKLQPPYSPDLAACYFFLFQKVKSAVKGQHLESTEDIQRSVMQALNDIPQTAFQEC